MPVVYQHVGVLRYMVLLQGLACMFVAWAYLWPGLMGLSTTGVCILGSHVCIVACKASATADCMGKALYL